MKTVKGVYAETQVKMICDNGAAKGNTIRIMLDVHHNKVGPIGICL